MTGQPGFFDLSDRYEALSAAGDPLERHRVHPELLERPGDRRRKSGAAGDVAVLAGRASVAPLVDINTAIMKGLRGQTEAAA